MCECIDGTEVPKGAGSCSDACKDNCLVANAKVGMATILEDNCGNEEIRKSASLVDSTIDNPIIVSEDKTFKVVFEGEGC